MSLVKKQLFEQLSLVAHSLSSPQRIELIDYLAQAERTVEELSLLADLSTANTSRHLQVLKKNGLVTVKKQGKHRIYTLTGEDVVLLVKQVRQVAESHLAQAERLKNALHANNSPSISIEAALPYLGSDQYLMVDVRPNKEYLQGHIKGAINVIPSEVDLAVKGLSQNKTIIAYCRGPYCTYSQKMIDALNAQGIHALRLTEGFPEWKAAGHPVQQSISRKETAT